MPKSKLIPLSVDERDKKTKELLLLMQDARARGIVVSNASDILSPKQIRWPLASNGYFLRNDGKLYEPSVNQKAFIDSAARFVLFIGGRGSGKSAAG